MAIDGPTEPPASAGAAAGGLRSELAVAVANALKLGGSMVLTWTVSLIVKLQVPAYLGPIGQGRFGFADGFAAMFFSAVGLGIDTYVYKEVTVRPAHASEFMGGVFVLRALISLLLFGAMTATLVMTGRPMEVTLTAIVFGLSQVLLSYNASLAAVLQAVSRVGRLAATNVAAKVVWGVGLLAGLMWGAPLWGLAAPMAAAELVRAAVLVPTARAAADLRYTVDFASALTTLRASFPYFINGVAVQFGNSLAIAALGYIRHDEREVGWFAACQNIASLAMLLHPLLVWIVMPMLSRAHARSPAEAVHILRRSIDGLVVVIGPATTFISCGADVFVRAAFGPDYMPATLGLSILSLVFLMTYTNIMLSSALVVGGRSWAATSISIASVFVLAGFTLVFVPLGRSMIGEGGECAGASMAVIASEAVTVAIMATRFPESPLDTRNVVAAIKTTGTAVAVLLLNRAIFELGAWRLVLDMLAYVAIAFSIRLVTVGDIRSLLSLVQQRRREKKGAADSSPPSADASA